MSGASVPPPYAPQPAPPTRPAGAFPWVACVIVGAIGFVLMSVIIIAAVGYFVFLKPKAMPLPQPVTPEEMKQMMQETMPPPPPAAPEEMKQMMQGAMPSMEGGASPPAGGEVTAEQAVEKVRARPEVAQWEAVVTAAAGSPHIDVDSEDAVAYTVHVFEVVQGDADMPGHTATMGWYTVDKATGEVRLGVP